MVKKKLKILISCLQGKESYPIPAYSFWRASFIEGCKEAGFEVLEASNVDWAEGLTYPTGSEELKKWRTKTWEKNLMFVRQTLKKNSINLFLSYLYPRQVDVSSIKEIQKMGIPCVNFFCDNVREFQKIPNEFYSFNLNWVPEYEALSMYKTAGLPFINLPMPCWIPQKLRNISRHEEKACTFIGSADILRQKLFGDAISMGANIKIYGSGWILKTKKKEEVKFLFKIKKYINDQKNIIYQYGLRGVFVKIFDKIFPVKIKKIPVKNLGNLISREELIRLTRDSMITLGTNRVPSLKYPQRYPLLYSRLRDIEAPMLGACYLTEFSEGLSHLYQIGKEIETYKTPEEMTEKIKELLNKSKKRQELRKSGQEKALNELSVPVSIAKILRRF